MQQQEHTNSLPLSPSSLCVLSGNLPEYFNNQKTTHLQFGQKENTQERGIWCFGTLCTSIFFKIYYFILIFSFNFNFKFLFIFICIIYFFWCVEEKSYDGT